MTTESARLKEEAKKYGSEDREVNSPRWLSLVDYEGEEWRDVVGGEGRYKVSNYGRVKCLFFYYVSQGRTMHHDEMILRQSIGRNYYTSSIYRKRRFVHRIVAEAFIGNPGNLPCINHKDENKLNNCAHNLEWCTNKYNSNYGTRNERLSELIRKDRSKTICQYDLSQHLLAKYNTFREAQSRTGVCWTNIRMACHGKMFIVGGFVWRYEGEPYNKYYIGKQRPTNKKIYKYDEHFRLVGVFESCKKAMEEMDNPRIYNAICVGRKRNLPHSIKTKGFYYSYKQKELWSIQKD